MPDNNGNYTLPPGYLATPGGVIRTSQHNPIFEDVRDAMNRRLMTTGDNPMTGDLPMGGNKITGLSDPSAAQDGATKAYVDGEVTGMLNSLGTAATKNHGTDPGEVPLNSDLGSMSLEDAGDYVTKASKATQGQAEGGTTGDVWMDDIRVRQAIEARAIWGNIDGVEPASIRASRGISSVSRLSAGRYQVSFAEPMPDANYAVVTGGTPVNSVSPAPWQVFSPAVRSQTTAGFIIDCAARGTTGTGQGDWHTISFAVFR